jgi:VWFA-related protein
MAFLQLRRVPGRLVGMRPLLLLLPAFLCCPALSQTPPPNPAGDVFRVTSELVVVDALVTHRKTGAIVGSLKPEDFEILEDGVRQEIVSFSRDRLPLSIVFLFDLTDSVQPVLLPLAEGAAEALQHLKTEDEIAVMVYQNKASLLQDFTTDRDLAVTAIRKAGTGERDASANAFFNEGVFQAAAQFRKSHNPTSRRVIVWLTDNVPNIPHDGIHTEQEALREVYDSGVVVCSLLEFSAMSRAMSVFHKHNPMFLGARNHHPPGDVNQYADRSGGIVLKSNKQEIARTLAHLIDELRSRYSIGYKPSVEKPAGQFCHIELRPSRDAEKRLGRMLIRTRNGYYR